jgi:AhpC/TSA family
MLQIRSTVIYDDVATELVAQPEAGDLWIGSGDLCRATGFDLKPQGVCRGELCYPLPPPRRSELLRDQSGQSWFNLTGFARLLGQPVAHDAAHSAWYFGVRPDQRPQLASLEAPDFTLPDLDGKLHSLSDFRGKKVFLVTWASW